MKDLRTLGENLDQRGSVSIADEFDEFLATCAYVFGEDLRDDGVGMGQQGADPFVLISAGVFLPNLSTTLKQDVFYSLWAERPINDTGVVKIKFEGVSDKNLLDEFFLEVEAGAQRYTFPTQAVSAYEILAGFELPMGAVMKGGRAVRPLHVELKVKVGNER